MKSILVTGGAGYIGSHTLVELISRGYDPIVVDNFSNSSPICLQRVEQITGKSVKCYNADIRNKAVMQQIFEENQIGSVIHFAGLKAVGESVAMPLEYYNNNVYGTIVLLQTMQKFGVKTLCFLPAQRCTAPRKGFRWTKLADFPPQTPTAQPS